MRLVVPITYIFLVCNTSFVYMWMHLHIHKNVYDDPLFSAVIYQLFRYHKNVYLSLSSSSLSSSSSSYNAIIYHHHNVGSMTYLPLFRVRSWNNGIRCMPFHIRIQCILSPYIAVYRDFWMQCICPRVRAPQTGWERGPHADKVIDGVTTTQGAK